MSISLPTLLTSLGAIAGAAALVVLAGSMGTLLVARVRLSFSSVLERWVVGAGIGLGLLSYLAFLLGVTSLLTPVTVRVLLLLCAIVTTTLWILRKRASSLAAESDVKAAAEPLPGWVVALVWTAGVFLLCALITCLGPIVDYDGLAYHAAAPKRWLELGGMHFLPTHTMTEWPMGCEMLFMLLMPVTGPAGCKPLMALLTFLTAGAVFALGSRLANRTVGGVSAALFILLAGFDKINTTSIEMGLTLYVTLTAYALTCSQAEERPEERPRWLLIAALMAGLGNCMKLNGLVMTLLFAVVVLALPRRAGVRPMDRLREAAWFIGIAVLCVAPWYARTWRDTGNPLYPFAYNVLGGRDWSVSASGLLSTYYHYFNLPGVTLAARHAVLTRLLLKIAFVIAVALLLPGPRWTRGILFAAGAFALIQIAISDQMRFLLPGLPFLVIVIAWWIARAADRWPLAGWAVALLVVVRSLPEAGKQAAEAIPAAVNGPARAATVRQYVNNYEACRWANQHLPSDARILFGPDTRTYYLERDAYWSHPIFQHLINFDTPQAFEASLQRNRINYVIFNRKIYDVPELEFEVEIGWRKQERQRLEELTQRSIPVFEANGVKIVRLAGER